MITTIIFSGEGKHDYFFRRGETIMKRRGFRTTMMLLAVALAATLVPGFAEANICVGKQTITANVVVLDNPTVFNRLGAQNPNWITYALGQVGVLEPGFVELRPDKRTRPLVVRSVAGACLTVNFTNLLAPDANPNNAQQDDLFNDDQVAGRCASFHAQGVELVGSITEDGSLVGNNHPDAVVTTVTAALRRMSTGVAWWLRGTPSPTTSTPPTRAPSTSTATAPRSAASRAAATWGSACSGS
jgi:hypothetical protein